MLMTNDCPFCRIIHKEEPADIVFEDRSVIAFNDIHPIAPVHFLVVPRKHISSMNELKEGDEAILGHMLKIGQEQAVKAGVDSSGYRLVINTGPNAGQAVFHLHLHVVGGRHLPFKFE